MKHLPFMMHEPLTTNSIIDYAAFIYPQQQVIGRENSGHISKTSYRNIASRAKAAASSFAKLGLEFGSTAGAFAWSTPRYLELFYAVPGMGGILHTINPRLHTDDLVYIINDAGNKVLFIDSYTWQAASAIADQLHSVETFIWLDDPALTPELHNFKNLHSYDELVTQGNGDYLWPDIDENSGCTLCYTSGTTGKPKGVVYTHRANVLLTLTSALNGFFGYPDKTGRERSLLSLTGMFHANAWMMPYAAPLIGAKLALVGRDYAPDKLFELIDTGEITLAAGVPTIVQSMVDYAKSSHRDFNTVEKIVVAGSRPSRGLVQALFEEFNVEIGQAWGMTEAQMGTMPVIKSDYQKKPVEQQIDCVQRGGMLNFGIRLRLVNDEGKEIPFDGKTPGHLQVKGNWITNAYLNHTEENRQNYITQDGWFITGDIALIHPDGYMEIVDRSKDLIKSGGEWIGSAIIESIVSSHPDIQESAVIGIHHPKWQERPLLIAVRSGNSSITGDDITDYLKDKIASWWLPDHIVFEEGLPKTGTGKIDKKIIKDRYKNWKPPI